MCGIVGIAGRIEEKEEIIFRTLLDLDVIRGRDSTGVVKVGVLSTSKPIITKAVGPPSNLIRKSLYLNYQGTFHSKSKCLIGHNRAATMGEVTVDNAHPFQFDHVYGVHNGTLRDWANLEGWLEFDVDSKALYKDVSKHGIESTWGKFSGAAALVWWDDKESSVNFARNKERPLYLARLNDGQTLMWASEEWMLKAAVIAGGKELDKEFSKGLENPFFLKTNSLHSFTVKGDAIPKLARVVELTPRYEPSFRKQVGFLHKNKTPQVNHGWAKTLPKCSKELLGVEFKFTRAFSFTKYPAAQEGLFHVNVGETEDGTEVFVFPTCLEDWDFYREVAFSEDMKDNIYEINRRPRLKVNGKKHTLCVSLDSIVLVEGYETEWEDVYDEEEERKIKSLGGECGFCAKTITSTDNYSYLYNDLAIVCEDCDHMKGTFK